MNRAKIFWNLFAKQYAKSPIKDMVSYEKTLNDTKKFLKQTDFVLEIGCGTGTTALALVDSVNNITATDISSGMVEIAKEKAMQQRINNIVFEQTTLSKNNFKKEEFDVVMAFNIFHLFKNTRQTIGKINELLKLNGFFISKTPCLKENKLMLLLAPFIRLFIGPISCFTISSFKANIVDEGFEIVDEYIYDEEPPRVFIVAKKIKK